jgi:tripartite ATP-independent transporter DctP family solute receptor
VTTTSLRYLLCFFLMLTIAGCTVKSDVKVIKLGHALDVNHSVHKAMVFLAEKVDEKSNGKMRIDVYPNGQLGSERELLELLQIGSIGMTKASAAVLESFMPSMAVVNLPYVFHSKDHYRKVLGGEIGQELLTSGEEFWMRGMCFYDAGSRSFYSKDKPIMKPEDLQGLKVRVQSSASAIQMVRLLGGSATPIPFGELYTALQQGVVDAAENNPPSLYLTRHYEVCRYYSLNEHTFVPDVMLVSTHTWDDLNDEQKKWLSEASYESAVRQRTLWEESENEALEAMIADGVHVEYPDKGPFIEKVRPMLDAFANTEYRKKLLERIEAVDESSQTEN